jgi:putative transposase
MTDIHPVALFRLSVLGPLASRERLERGELKVLIRELAGRSYAIPGAKRTRVSEKTLESWYYAWRRGGIEALAPKARCDKGGSKLSAQLQAACLQAKRDNPRRSLNSLLRLLQMAGLTAQGELSRSSLHRLLKRHGLSRVTGCPSAPVERRSFVAARAGDIWYGDVMHGPKVAVKGRMQKVYLASLMDDASRLIAHSAFCPGETALDIEGVLKQAVLKRGLPKKLVIDNGAAYRAASLQGICARLEIRLIYCRPYAPEGKGKLERWHRTVRDAFLSELDLARVRDLADLNARLWAWVEAIYHRRAHSALEGLTPLERWQQDLVQVRPLGPLAAHLDALFYHRVLRKVRRDATVSFEGRRFEVPYELAGRTLVLVVDPHGEQALAVESEDGQPLGAVAPLDALANAHRKRRQPAADPVSDALRPRGLNAVELAYRQYTQALGDNPSTEEDSQ